MIIFVKRLNKNFMKKSITVSAIAIATIGLTSCTPKTSTVSGVKTTSTEKLAEGKTIFENSCGKCHALPNPTEHTSVQWVGIMNAMAPKAKLNEEQHQLVYDYVVSVKK